MTIYFIRAVDCGRIKIGYTDGDTPAMRLNGMRTGNPSELEVLTFCPGEMAREQELHGMLRTENVRGEWFTPSDRVASLVGYVQQFKTTEGWFPTISPIEISLGGFPRERQAVELDNIWRLVQLTPPEKRRLTNERAPFNELVERFWTPFVIPARLAVEHQFSGRPWGSYTETMWIDRFSATKPYLSRGAHATAGFIAAIDHDPVAVAAVWIQAALRDCAGKDEFGIPKLFPEASWLAEQAESVHRITYHHAVSETLPIGVVLPRRAVISASEFIRLTALTQAATAARYLALVDYVNGAYSSAERKNAA